jgi:tetratricopeptide (TPR) repeat protein
MGSNDDAGSLNHLPGAPRQFLNRVPELDDIAATVAAARAAEQPALVCLTGMAGMGKTTLAVQAAYRYWTKFPAAQFYYDLRGSAPDAPADPADLLGYWLRQLGDSEEDLPVGLSKLASRFRSRTYGLRFLMILDDAYSAAQIRELLPSSPTSLVIVTSRRWFDELGVAGFGEIKIGRFADEVSAELLRHSIGPAVLAAETEAVRDLIAVCGGTPLVLKVASARIGRWRRPGPVSAFVTTLRSQQALAQLHLDGTPQMEAIYDLCYAELTPPQAKAYRLLALHPGPDFGVGAAAAMLGLASEPAADVLYELQELELLDRIGPGRFRFHHLIGVHARHRAFLDADEQRRRSAVGAAVVYYLEFLIGRAKAMSQRPLEGPYAERIPATYTGAGAAVQAVADLEIENQSLRAAVDAADKLELDAECLELCEVLRGWLYDTDRTAELAEVLAVGVRVAQRCGDDVWQLQMLRHVAVAYEKQGSRLDAAGFKAGRDALKQARQIAERLDKPLVVASTVEWDGLLYEARGQLDEALRQLRVAYTLVQEVAADPAERRRMLALLDMHIGRVLVGLGEQEAAVVNLDRALADFTDRGDEWVNVARLRHLLGAVALAGNRLQEAQEYLDAAAEAFRDQRFASQELTVQRLRAETASRRGDGRSALAALREALALAQRLGSTHVENELSRQIAELHG